VKPINFSLSGGLVEAEITLQEISGLVMLRRSRLLATLRVVGRSDPQQEFRLLGLSLELGAGRDNGPYVLVGSMGCDRAIGTSLSAGSPAEELRCEIALDAQQIEALDSLRGPEGLTLHIRLQARYERRRDGYGGDAHSMQDRVVLNPIEWSQLLRNMGYRGFVFVEVPIPDSVREELRRGVDLLREAQAALHTHTPREVVEKCRQALEALRTGRDDGAWLGGLADRRLENTKEERFGVVRRAVQALNHLAMHEDPVAAATTWTRDDAVAALGLTASILRWYAVTPQ